MKQTGILSVIFTMILLSATAGFAADLSNPLPAWETAEEAALRALYGFPNSKDVDTPPAGTVQSQPEWAPADGVLIAWMGFTSFLTEMTREFVQIGKCYIVVESASQQTTVENTLTSAGVPLTNVEFLIFNMDSVWMVDYGPFFVSVDGNREIVDHIYDRYSRWEDDAFPGRLGGEWSIPVYESDLRIEGGNFIADGNGVCFITDRVIEQNSGNLTEQEVYDRLDDYCGCETVYVLDRLNDGTGHIDMFAKLLDEDTMLLAQYEVGDPEYQTLEDNADYIATLTSSEGTPYEIVRIPMPGSPSAYWTYTNSLIVNDHVFVPTYNVSGDANALSIYESAMPGYTIVSIDASDVIGSGGAVHCTTRVVPTAAEYSASIAGVTVDDSAGDADGFADPGETVYLQIQLRNGGIQDLTNISGTLTSDQPGHITILDNTAAWPDLATGTSADSLAPHFQIAVDPGTPEDTEVTFSLDVSADSYTGTQTCSITVSSLARVYFWDLDTNPGWTTEAQWAYGVPTGGGGSYGSPDPTSGYTGSNVYGYNLNGDYLASMGSTEYLTSESFDCSEVIGAELKFRCWLGVEQDQYDHAYIEISTNGSTWNTVWENTTTLSGGSWDLWEFDISSWADGESSVQIRWGMGATDSAWQYCGWNIDDIEIWGMLEITDPTPTPSPSPTPTPACLHHGDVNFDGEVTAGDAQMAFEIALGMYPADYLETCAADCNGDGEVTAGDAQLVFMTALGAGNCTDPV